MSVKYVYIFTPKKTDGSAGDRNLLGGKGANLAEMSRIGIPVPPGFTISTDVCTYYYNHDSSYPKELKVLVDDAVKTIEKEIGKDFGDVKNPLLFSVRSGARASMPGMMDTILNLGLNDKTVEGLAKSSKNPRFAYDSYRRFIQMYSNVVLEADHGLFEHALAEMKAKRKVKLDTELTAADLKDLVEEYKKIGKQIKKEVPQDVMQQLWGAIGAVFGSWMNERAIIYRKLNGIPAEWGTAVNVQAMVFGNMGNSSATGVCFSRDPATGENAFFGEYLINAQGEDVVAGIRTPQPMTEMSRKRAGSNLPSMETEMPKLFKELVSYRDKLENYYRDMQDMEFTIEEGRLWMLQTRNGKRTMSAALKIAVDMVEEKMISKEMAISRIDAAQLDQLLHPTLDPKAKNQVIAKGLPASPGAAVGKVVFNAKDAEEWVKKGEKVILVRVETSPDDIGGMHVSQGILTARGGMTSHAAVVARGMGTPCVSGSPDVTIDYNAKLFKAKDVIVREGDIITLDGGTGRVMLGAVPTKDAGEVGDFKTLMTWVDEIRTMKVRTNADTPHDAKVAVKFGAEGIGLCRTEHMFFDANRIQFVREMILAADTAAREKALDKLLPFQRDDFEGIFTAMKGLPVTIRLLDPPLHEFLPQDKRDIAILARNMDVNVDDLEAKISQLHEFNPMLGHRGCRLSISYPEIARMQVQAICEAAVNVAKKLGIEQVKPEIMIPLVGTKAEYDIMHDIVKEAADDIFKKAKLDIKYMIGTMIELPRACLAADKIADKAEFFSFGTNDLTQTTLGMSRDDAGSFLDEYVEKGIYLRDPFVTIDQDGVGEMVDIAIQRGRKTRPGIKLGICGEHGGDPETVKFLNKLGLNYVSCSPYRVPIARLAAAQGAIEQKASGEK